MIREEQRLVCSLKPKCNLIHMGYNIRKLCSSINQSVKNRMQGINLIRWHSVCSVHNFFFHRFLANFQLGGCVSCKPLDVNVNRFDILITLLLLAVL